MTVDAIKNIDSVRSMPLVDNNDSGDQAIEAFKQALIKLRKTLRDIVQDNHMTELNNEIKKVLESNEPEVLKTFRDGPALGKIRNLVVGQVTEYFEDFHFIERREISAKAVAPEFRRNEGRYLAASARQATRLQVHTGHMVYSPAV